MYVISVYIVNISYRYCKECDQRDRSARSSDAYLDLYNTYTFTYNDVSALWVTELYFMNLVTGPSRLSGLAGCEHFTQSRNLLGDAYR